MMEADPDDLVVMEGEPKYGIHSALSACYSLSPESVHLHQDYLVNREFSSYQAGGGKVLYE